MKTAAMQIKTRYRKLSGIAMVLTLAGLIGGLSSMPARADDDRERNVQRERSQAPRHLSHRYYRHEAPRYVYAPPPVYYAPPLQPPVIDFIFPLRFR